MSEFQDEYSENLEGETSPGDGAKREFAAFDAALLNDQVTLLNPSEPLALTADQSVQEAIAQMVARRRSGVTVVDGTGRLVGIFTERDVLTRVVGPGLDLGKTRLSEVMTPEPEALAPQDRICYAINRMNNAGYRTIPLVDARHRPIGVVTVNDVIRWLTGIFPDELLNLRPGDRLKNPHQIDAG
jgi:CBS domain-containing protein